ncbi:MAG: transcriptional regulator NrdR [Bdellovibrionota bacterium]|nr:MAG: transcriptional regulator NrdR [Bdellovibrionota bacterium]
MECPKCGSDKLSVVDSRSDGSAIRRRRECQSCTTRFTTFERIELSLPMVVKKDGRREPFAREKVMSGMLKACEKRPVSMEVIESTVDDIERRVSEMCEKEISSRLIGDLLMEALKGVDTIAYVRFASVYREFSDVKQFVDTLKNLNPVLSPQKAAAPQPSSSPGEQ